jgi:hypothetical protein
METLLWILVLYVFIGGLTTALYLYDAKRSTMWDIKLSKKDVKDALEMGFIGVPCMILYLGFHILKALLLGALLLAITAFILYCVYQITN